MALFGDGMTKDVEVQISADGSDAVSSIDNVVESLGGLHVAAGLAGAALAGLGVVGLAKATSAAADFETAMTEVQKVTSEQTVDELHDDILQLSERIPLAQTELANIAEIAGRLGVEGSANIANFTETTAKMSTATNLSAEEAANSFARLSNALGTPITQMENMGSAVNTLSNNVAASSDEIVSSMLKAAPAAAQLSVTFQDLAAIQSTLVASGMQVERAGTRMNRAFTKMSQSVPQIAQAVGMSTAEFRQLVENNPTQALQMYLRHLQQIDSKTQRVNEATEIFGTAGAKAVLTLAENTDSLNQSLDDSSSSYEKATSLQREYDLAVDTFNKKAQILKNRLGNIAIVTGEAVLPAMTALLDGLIFLTGVFATANEATDGFLGTFALFSLVLGGGALAAWGAAAAVGGLTGAVGLLTAALGVLFSPITLIIAAISALAAAWTTNFLGIRDKTEKAVGFVTNLLDEFTRFVLEMVDDLPMIDINVDKIMEKRQQLRDSFASLPGEIADSVSSAKDEVTSGQSTSEMLPTPGQSAVQQTGAQDAAAYSSGFQQGLPSASAGGGEGGLSSKDRGLRDFYRSMVNNPKTSLDAKRNYMDKIHALEGPKNVPETQSSTASPPKSALRPGLGSAPTGATSTSARPTSVPSGVSGDLQRHVNTFGKAVDKFAAAVEQGKEVVLRVEGDSVLAEFVRSEVERENKRRGRQADNFNAI